MADIFISYASDDRSRAEPLAKALEEQGWSVWWDRTIPPGKTFDQVIEEAINAASCVIVLWSEKSIKSDWVKEEANIGKRRNILVPAKIDPVDPPLGFARIQAADLISWEAEKSLPGFFSLLNAISEIAGPPLEGDKGAHDTELLGSNLEQQRLVKSDENETFQPDSNDLKPLEKGPPITGRKAPRKKWVALGIGAVALISILSVYSLFNFLYPKNPNIEYDDKTGFEWLAGPNQDMTWKDANDWAENLGGAWGLPSRSQLIELFQNEKVANSLCQKSGTMGMLSKKMMGIWSKDKRDSMAWMFHIDESSHGYRPWEDKNYKRAFAVRDRKWRWF